MKIYNSHEYILEKAKCTRPICAFDAEKDFSIWKEQAKDKLTELLGLPFEKCEDLMKIKARCKTEEYESIAFEFQSEEGYFIPCELIVPLGEKKPRPTVICLQGHSTGKHITMGKMKYPIDERSVKYSNHAIRAIREGLCAVVFDQRYMGTA
jgi:cephalosporin-C deacetylase-like acetyl esterase